MENLSGCIRTEPFIKKNNNIMKKHVFGDVSEQCKTQLNNINKV